MKKLLLLLFLLCFGLSAKAQSSCPDSNHPHMIDLGLPSGTLWACCNVGASKPEEYGGYYAWGETEEKDYYSISTYKFAANYTEEDSSDKYMKLGEIECTQNDVAHVKWGGTWQMPNYAVLFELLEECKMKWSSLNGHNGIIITGPNQNRIFLPACGTHVFDLDGYSGSTGLYPSSTDISIIPYLIFNSTGWAVNYEAHREWGCPVRPVILKKQTLSEKMGNSNSNIYPQSKSFTRCPDNNHPHAIDLGLPSGTKWACCNVGASTPTGYGGHYAWGETVTKDYYDANTYSHCDGTRETSHHIGNNIAGTKYDVAHVKWGGTWRMPTIEQIKELKNNCRTEWKTQNGVRGLLVTGRNGGIIYLPAAGRLWTGDGLLEEGESGAYWSSSLAPYEEIFASDFTYVISYWISVGSDNRFVGRSVRPVCK